jgi:CDP-paratose synthetase
MKILITGVTGFIGSRMAIKLIKDGHIVFGLLRKTSNIQRLAGFENAITFIYIEEDNINNVISENSDIRVIIHAATDFGRDDKLTTSVYWSNLHLPMLLLDLALKYKIQKFINLDTFFNNDKSNYDYLVAYSLSKRNFQEWGKLISEKLPINFINLRLFHVFGPNDGENKFVTNLIRNCIAGQEIDLTSGIQERDFIFIDDVINAINLFLTIELNSGYHSYDVGSGIGTSIKDFAINVNKICGGKSNLNFGNLPTRSGELDTHLACIKGLKDLGWFPKTDLQSGLLLTVKQILNNK